MVVLYFGLQGGQGGFSQGSYHSHTFLRFCRSFKVSSGKLLRSFPHDVHVNYASMRAWDWWNSFHLPWKSISFFVRLPFEKTYHDRNLLWKRNETSSKQQSSHHNGPKIFCPRNRYVTCGLVHLRRWWWIFFQRSRWSPLQLRWWWEVALFWSWCGTATGADDCDGWDDFR